MYAPSLVTQFGFKAVSILLKKKILMDFLFIMRLYLVCLLKKVPGEKQYVY